MPVDDESLYAGMSWEQLVWACAERCLPEDPALRTDVDADPHITEPRATLAREEARLAKRQGWSLDDLRRDLAERQEKLKAERDEKVQRAEAAGLRPLLHRALDWTPPTPDHRVLKDEIVNSLCRALCISNYVGFDDLVEQENLVEQHLHLLVAAAEQDVERARKKLQEALDRAARRDAWVLALNDVVPQPPRAPTAPAGHATRSARERTA